MTGIWKLRSQRNEVGGGRRLGEPDDPEVGLMHLEQRADLPVAPGDGPPVVVDPRPVGRSDLDEPGAALLQDVGDPEGTPDFDQLPPGHHHVLPGGEGVEREQDSAGGIPGDGRGPSRKHGFEEAAEVFLAAPPGAGSEIELEIGVTARGAEDGLRGALRERRPPQIGVDDHAGGVDHPPEVRPGGPVEPRLHGRGEPRFRIAGEACRNGRRAHGPAEVRNLGPDRSGDEGSPEAVGEAPEALRLEKPPDCGKLREGF